jgi:hypothetical protein
MSHQSNFWRARLVAIAFTLWASAVTVAFLAANSGHLITKLTERGILR